MTATFKHEGSTLRHGHSIPNEELPTEFNTEPHTLANTKKGLTGYDLDPRMGPTHVVRDSHDGEKHDGVYSQGTQHLLDGAEPGSSEQVSLHGI